MNPSPSKINRVSRPQLDSKFIVTIEGKEFVTYQGLLDAAHKCGLSRIETEILQYPSPENQNTAVVRAVAEAKEGELYADIGDANPSNCNAKVARHLMRMASTRAKARALRDLTNVGITAIEELADDSEAEGENDDGRLISGVQAAQKPSPLTLPPKSNRKVKQDRALLSDAQTRAIDNLCRRRDIHEDQLQEMAMEQFGVSVQELSPEQAGHFIRQLQQAA